MGEKFSERVIALIRDIPAGRVATYGMVAAFAGNVRAARQVAYILHSSSGKRGLPWHRVVNSKGTISLKPGHGYELQKSLLENEEIVFDEADCIDLRRFLWTP